MAKGLGHRLTTQGPEPRNHPLVTQIFSLSLCASTPASLWKWGWGVAEA